MGKNYLPAKEADFAARWENGAAKKGPWSEILSAVIP
jgi:hypothetical protein